MALRTEYVIKHKALGTTPVFTLFKEVIGPQSGVRTSIIGEFLTKEEALKMVEHLRQPEERIT